MLRIAPLLTLSVLCFCDFAAAQFVLPSGCKLAFASIKNDGLDIDDSCSIDGNSGDDVGKRLESNAKNNFCVTGKPTTIQYATFKSLQREADNQEDLRATLKTDRSVLKSILPTRVSGVVLGEGTLVQFVALVLDAHNSNVGKKKPPKKEGELVNCNHPDKESNDIHIELTNDPNDDDACDSVTAEMSPHFRPDAWSDLPDMQIRRPVRITGPLFFDSSHQPCRGGKRVSPARISVWEIHPVYAFDVCTSKVLATCRARISDDSMWVPLDQWHEHQDVESDN